MRVTDQSKLAESLVNIQRGQERLAATQNKATTGLQIAQPSDNTVAWNQINAQQAQLARLDAYNSNITAVQARLSATEASLQTMNGYLTRFRELVMTAANQPSTGPSVPTEAGQIYDQMVSLTNQTFNGEYLFNGFSGTAPFSGATFVGDNQKRAVQISPLGATVFGISAQDAFGVQPGQTAFAGLAQSLQGMRTGNLAQITSGLDAVDQQMKDIGQSLAMLGAQQNTLTLAQSANQAYALTLQKSISGQRDADPAAAYSQLAADQYTVQATYAVLGTGSKLSILNYI